MSQVRDASQIRPDAGTGAQDAAGVSPTDAGGLGEGGEGVGSGTWPAVWMDTAWNSAASANVSTVDITAYFPLPPAGQARINMFASPAGYYTAEKIWAPDPSAGNRTRIDDYRTAPDGTSILSNTDTWYIHNPRVAGGTTVRELLDVFYANGAGSYDMSAGTPFNHGSYTTTVGGSAPNVSSKAHGYSLPSGTWDDISFDIFIQDVKASVATNVGPLSNVTLQVEHQYSSGFDIKYIFYFAPGIGLVATQQLDANWNRIAGFLQIWKTCVVADTEWLCP